MSTTGVSFCHPGRPGGLNFLGLPCLHQSAGMDHPSFPKNSRRWGMDRNRQNRHFRFLYMYRGFFSPCGPPKPPKPPFFLFLLYRGFSASFGPPTAKTVIVLDWGMDPPSRPSGSRGSGVAQGQNVARPVGPDGVQKQNPTPT